MLLTVDLDRLRLRSGERLLDAGCGEGRHCFGALERGAQVVGLDLDAALSDVDPDARQLLREGLRLFVFNSDLSHELGALGAMLRGDAFHLPFRDETFDKVICSEVMEHVHDFRAAARELARVTQPHGMVAVTIPTATSEHLYLHVGDDYFESPGGHIRIFKPRELARGLAQAGLVTVGVGFAHALHTPYWVLRSLTGLPHADTSALVRGYRAFLIRATASKAMNWLERALNYCFPKSLILYTEKRRFRSAAQRP